MKKNIYARFSKEGDQIIDSGSLYGELSELRAEFGNMVIVDPSDLPADFSIETYTIENGELVKASPEVIAEREAAARAAYNEAQRLKREAEYRATTDPRVLEIIADSTPSIAALKDAIREKYPYKEPPAVTPAVTPAI